jgi:hypothetical protein
MQLCMPTCGYVLRTSITWYVVCPDRRFIEAVRSEIYPPTYIGFAVHPENATMSTRVHGDELAVGEQGEGMQGEERDGETS